MTDEGTRDLNLLKKSFRALEAELADGIEEGPAPATATTDEPEASSDDEPVAMYRGRPIRRGGGSTPGAGSTGQGSTQFRGSGRSSDRGRKTSGKPQRSDADKIKAALAALIELRNEGLISPAEFDLKKQQLLDRL